MLSLGPYYGLDYLPSATSIVTQKNVADADLFRLTLDPAQG
jgi:hypothetical protein